MLISWLYSTGAMSRFVGIPLGFGGQVAMLWAFTHQRPTGTNCVGNTNRSLSIVPEMPGLANRKPTGQLWALGSLDALWSLGAHWPLMAPPPPMASNWSNATAMASVGQQGWVYASGSSSLLVFNWVNSQHLGVIGLGLVGEWGQLQSANCANSWHCPIFTHIHSPNIPSPLAQLKAPSANKVNIKINYLYGRESRLDVEETNTANANQKTIRFQKYTSTGMQYPFMKRCIIIKIKEGAKQWKKEL